MQHPRRQPASRLAIAIPGLALLLLVMVATPSCGCQEPPSIFLSNVIPPQVNPEPGQEFVLGVYVYNAGEARGKVTVKVIMDGQEVGSRGVLVPGKAGATTEFTLMRSEPGRCFVTVKLVEGRVQDPSSIDTEFDVQRRVP